MYYTGAALSVRQYPPVVIASNNLFSAEFALNNNSISSSVHTAAAEVISVSSRQRRANESCAKFETARLRLTARPYNPPTIRTRAVKPWPIYHNIKKVIDRCTSSLREEEWGPCIQSQSFGNDGDDVEWWVPVGEWCCKQYESVSNTEWHVVCAVRTFVEDYFLRCVSIYMCLSLPQSLSLSLTVFQSVYVKNFLHVTLIVPQQA